MTRNSVMPLCVLMMTVKRLLQYATSLLVSAKLQIGVPKPGLNELVFNSDDASSAEREKRLKRL